MRKLFLFFVAFLATSTLLAQRFQVGDLYYQVIGGYEDNGVENMPTVPNPGAGRTTVVLYVPLNTPAGCYAVGTANGWNDRNTDFMFTPVEGAVEGWVSCTFDYTEDLQIKVLAIPSDPAVTPGWSYQWGKNMDWENDLEEDNVVILDGTGYLELENQGQPKLVGLEDNGVIYIQVKDWASDPYIEPIPCETAAFNHPWEGYYWEYREATKTADATFEINDIYGGVGVNVATDIYGTNENWYPEDQIEFVGDVAVGDYVNFKFISEKRTFGRMIVTLIEKGTEPWYAPSKKSPSTPQKRSNTDSPRQVMVTYQYEWSSDNYANLTAANIPATVEYRGVTYDVVGIKEYAFAYSPITSITIPNSVTSIGDGAFCYCSSLASVTIPNSVTSIGDGAFYGCSSLTAPVYNAHYFAYLPTSYEGAYVVPDGIQYILDQAFSNCTALTSVTLDNSVTNIGDQAFYGCSSLAAINLPNTLQMIGNGAFAYCSALTSITIPNGVTSIGGETFVGCSSLEHLSIPNSVKFSEVYEDEDYTWDEYLDGFICITECYNLKTLIVPADFFGVRYLDDYYEGDYVEYFAYLPKQLESLTINGRNMNHPFGWDFINRNRKSLKHIDFGATESIEEEAFKNLYSLESLILPSQIETIPYMAVAECVKLKSISIPATVTAIEDRAFENCRMLSSVEFAENGALTRIGNWAFYNNHELTNLVIPEGVTEVGHAAFYGCTYLKEMTLPSTVQEIADNGFALCAKLQRMNVDALIPPTVAARTFEEVDRTIPVYVPDEVVPAYQSAPIWQEFNIQGKSDAPSAVDNIQSHTTNTQKLLRDGQLLILRDGKTYNAMGQEL